MPAHCNRLSQCRATVLDPHPTPMLEGIDGEPVWSEGAINRPGAARHSPVRARALWIEAHVKPREKFRRLKSANGRNC